MKKIGLIIVVLGLSSIAQSQVAVYSDAFMSIGVGAQALSMAGSVVASVNDVTAGYWNPAGLVYNNDLQFSAMHNEYFEGISDFDYLAATIPLKNDRYIGFSAIRFGTDDIPNTLFLVQPDGSINYNDVTTFSAADYGFLFSYAQKIKKIKGLSIGGSAKVIYRIVGSFADCWGFGFDVGAQYHLNNLYIGVMARDITTTFNAWSFNFTDAEQDVLAQTGNEIPTSSIELTTPTVIYGVAYNFNIGKKFGVMPELDIDMTTDGMNNVLISSAPFSFEPHFGIELNYKHLIYIRGGIGNIQRAINDVNGDPILTAQPDIGVGLRLGAFTLDYAFTNLGNVSESPYSNVFSVKMNIANKKTRVH
jgi:hypothetical protein